MGKKISIIVPVYNNERYINDCLNSILNIKNINIECIVIDDGSTDRSGNIINNFAEKHSFVKVIRTANKGVSRARNIGLNAASGEYIMFIDSDDYFTENIKNVINKISLSDMTVFAHNVINGNNIITKHITISNDIPHKNKIEDMIKCNVINSCWGKCFKTAILKDNNIRFDENIQVGEDTCFVINYLKYCSSINFIDIPIMTYRKTSFNTMSIVGIEILGNISKTASVKKEFVKSQNLDSSLYIDIDYYYYRLIIDYSLNDLKCCSFKKFGQKYKKIFNKNKNILLSINKSKIGITGRILLYLLKKRMFYLYYILLKVYSKI